MQKTCVHCQTAFEVTDDDLKFYEDVSPVYGGTKELIPPPTKCPDCRRQQRMLFRNLRNLHTRTCDLTGETILSSYPPEAPLKVYTKDAWWSDKWDPLDYGRDFDFNRPFFEQWAELYHDVPVIPLYIILCQNSDYVNGAAHCKNCYLCFCVDICEDCLYLADSTNDRWCFDCLSVNYCELCYESVSCDNCYHLFYSHRCSNCSDSFFLSDCKRCTNCIGCCNLVDKEYHIFNKQVSKEEFENQKQALMDPEIFEKIRKQAEELEQQFPKKYYSGHTNEEFSGENIHHLKNSYSCFDSSELENCKYCHYTFKIHNCYDFTIFGNDSEWIYNCLATGVQCSNNRFCMYCWEGSANNLYCHLMNASKNCFGCSGLNGYQYCIFNKQYSQDEYEILVPKIIEHMRKTGEWGEFFPKELSPFGYNQTVAYEYYPLEKEEAQKQGFVWRDIVDEMPGAEQIIPGEKLPKNISEVPDDILNWAIKCPESGRPFKIVKKELDFYRDQNLPVPMFHPDVRHFRRIAKRNPRMLWQRKCDKCQKAIESSYSPEREETVYCEECYREAVY